MFKSKRYNDTFSSQNIREEIAVAEEEKAIAQEISSLASGIDFILTEIANKVGIQEPYYAYSILGTYYGEYDHLKHIVPIFKREYTSAENWHSPYWWD